MYEFIPYDFLVTSTDDICMFRIGFMCSKTWTECNGTTDPIECPYSYRYKIKSEWKNTIIQE